MKIIPPGFSSTAETTAQKIARRQTGISQPGIDQKQPRESVLKRLYDDVVEDADETVPTLKEFKYLFIVFFLTAFLEFMNVAQVLEG